LVNNRRVGNFGNGGLGRFLKEGRGKRGFHRVKKVLGRNFKKGQGNILEPTFKGGALGGLCGPFGGFGIEGRGSL